MGSHSGGYGGYQSPMVKQELAKLDKGGDKRRSAMVSLRSCVDNLDASTMPRFLAQISDTRDVVSDSRTYAISLYQDVARVHGKLVVPHIPRIMATVIRSLSSSGSSIHLHEACAKVVASIPRYAVDSTSGAMAAEAIFYEVCTPLMDVLLGKIEPLAAGAAICLQAVVESEKWKVFAPQQLVGDLCSKCNMALRERTGQTVGHLHLARALVKTEAVSAECGASFLRAAKEVLRTAASSSWQHRAAALQLVRALMLSLDRKVLDSESESIAQIVEQIRLDRMPHVRNEAVKALQALKARVQDGEQSPSKRLSFSRDGAQPRCRTLWEREDVTSNSQESHLISCSPPPASSKTSTPDSSPSSAIRRSKRYGSLLHSRRTSSFSSSASSDESFTNVDEAKEEVVAVANPAALRYQASDSQAGATVTDEAEGDHCVTVGSQAEDEYELTTIMDGQTASALMNNADETPSQATPLGSKLSSETSTLTAEDFFKFTTPRRLVRSLQTLVSSPDTSPPDTDSTPAAGSFDMQLEASSESGWSVRDNPIAEEHHRFYDSHRNSKLGSYGGAKTLLNPETEARSTTVEAGTARDSSKTGSAISKVRTESRRWHKARACIELALGFCLCFVLLVPLLLAMVQVINARASSELHALVPT